MITKENISVFKELIDSSLLQAIYEIDGEDDKNFDKYIKTKFYIKKLLK